MLRFLADADLNDDIAKACRLLEPTMDFLSSAEARLQGVPDPEVLAIAAREGRILVTHDLRTMPYHFGDFLMAGNRCPGVFWLKQEVPVGVAARALILKWSASSSSEWENRILELVRVR